MRRIRWVVVAAVLAAAVTGCGVPSFGAPAGPEPFVGVELPPRPREVSVRDVNPCDLLTEEQRAEIGLETPPLLSPADGSAFFEGPEPLCTSNAFRPRSILVGVATPYDGLGVRALTGRPVQAELTVLDVQGFPAVLGRPTDPLFCQVLVDVAPGEALSVIFRDGGLGEESQDALCRDVVPVANAAMSTLLSLPDP